MATEFFAGNEKGDYRGDGLSEVGFGPLQAINQRGGSSTPLGNGGSFFYYLGPGVGTPSSAFLQKNLSGPLTEVYGQFAYNAHVGGESAAFRFLLGSVVVGTIYVFDRGSPYIGFRFRRGDGTQIGGDTPDSYNANNGARGGWTLVEFHLKPAASGGVFELWVDGVPEITVLNGNITGPGGEVTFDTIQFGQNTNQNQLYDDIVVNNTLGTVNNGRPNGAYIIPQFPVLPGTFSQLTNSFGNSTNNYQFINNLPVNRPNIGYVGTNTPAQKDTYKMTPMPLEFVGVNAVKVSAFIAKNGPAITHARGVLIPNAETEIDLPGAPGTLVPVGGFGWVEMMSEINPNTSNPYTAAEINNLEAGLLFNA